nr:hypothetical protein [Subtercola sp. Z020]
MNWGVEHDVREGRGDESDHHLACRALGPNDLLQAERHGEHGNEREHDGDVGGCRGHRRGIRPQQRDQRIQEHQPESTEQGAGDCRTPDGERRDALDLAGLRRVVLRRPEQPRDECPAADPEHSADRHDQAEKRGAEGDRGEQGGVVQRADEARTDDIVDGADDHGGGHRHAEMEEGAHDRRGREVPAVGALLGL